LGGLAIKQLAMTRKAMTMYEEPRTPPWNPLVSISLLEEKKEVCLISRLELAF
jgi:hypothetical protein